MHPTSYELMREIKEHYIVPLFTIEVGKLELADVGAHDVNGIYRPLFQPPFYKYHGIDLHPGPNVDIVVPEPYHWSNIESDRFDVVISGQVLEHVPQPWRWIEEVKRICKPGGLIVIIAPNSCPYHEYPIDCWRVWPDGMKGLFEHAGLILVKTWATPKSYTHLPDLPDEHGDTAGIAYKPHR